MSELLQTLVHAQPTSAEYLDHVYIDYANRDEQGNVVFPEETNEDASATFKNQVVVKAQRIELEERPDEDELVDKVVSRIMEAAGRNDYSNKLVYNVQETVGEMGNRRRILTKIAMGSSLIAINSRRGPAQFAILSTEMFNRLLPENAQKLNGPAERPRIAGPLDGMGVMGVVFDAAENSIYLGRKDENGIVLGYRQATDETPAIAGIGELMWSHKNYARIDVVK